MLNMATTHLGPIALIANIIINIILAIAVYSNALDLHRNDQKVKLMNGFFWFLITLYSGVLGAALYWFVNQPKQK